VAAINWRRVWAVMKVHGWRWADLARKMGITEPHLSMVKTGKRPVTMAFADLLCHVLQLSYDQVLTHPTVDRQPSAREVLAMTTLDDERPWPGTKRDHHTSYQHWEREQALARALDAQPR
jgi:transcriptional regulator with XRE-family HTH domain